MAVALKLLTLFNRQRGVSPGRGTHALSHHSSYLKVKIRFECLQGKQSGKYLGVYHITI